jgi:hypothetical protein
MYKKDIWQIIPGLEIHGKPAPYWVLNERAIRATAWIMFAIWFFTVLTILYTQNYFLLHIVVPVFFADFLLKVLVWPKYSPFSFLGKLLVSKQKPEYVWAVQKRFAWALWLLMSWSVIIIAIIYDIHSFLPLTLCSICLLFMWMESALGICVGCKIYGYLLKKWILKTPEHRPACPGGACSLK